MSMTIATPVFNRLVDELGQCAGCLRKGWPLHTFPCSGDDVLCTDSDRTLERIK